MCLSVPGVVERIEGSIAFVNIDGIIYEAGTQLVESVSPGEYVLVHSGYILSTVDIGEAQLTLELYRDMKRDEKI